MRYLRWFSLLTVITATGCADGATAPERLRLPGSMVTADFGDALEKNGGARAKVYCTGASCYAAAFEFKDYKDPVRDYTIFSAYFQNLQGTYPPNGSTAAVSLNWFKFQFFDVNPSDDYVDADAGPVIFTTLGNVLVGEIQFWSNDSPALGLNSDTFFATGHGIMGCDGAIPQFPLSFFSFQTCLTSGLDGWVRVDFKLFHNGQDPSPAPVRFHDFVFSFGKLGGSSCSVGGGQPGTCSEIAYNRAMKQ